MVTDIGIFQVAHDFGGIRVLALSPYTELPFYTDTWFKAVIAAALVVVGAFLRQRVA